MERSAHTGAASAHPRWCKWRGCPKRGLLHVSALQTRLNLLEQHQLCCSSTALCTHWLNTPLPEGKWQMEGCSDMGAPCPEKLLREERDVQEKSEKQGEIEALLQGLWEAPAVSRGCGSCCPAPGAWTHIRSPGTITWQKRSPGPGSSSRYDPSRRLLAQV